MIRILLSLLIVIGVGCSEKEKSSSSVYFAGEIVNPTSDYVVLFKDDNQIDSAKLDENNRFEFHLDHIEEGLHNFLHAPEYQYIYLEEGDSLVIRLNTTDFDESLVFAGSGDAVNNFLLEMYLTNEEEEALINSYFSLKPEQFSRKIDSLRQYKLNLLGEIDATAELSEHANQLARASIDYNYYIYKEMYPFYFKKRMGLSKIPELTANFYEYREALDLNNEHLAYFRPYYKFINYHLGNITYMQCLENCETHDQSLESYLHTNMHKLALIDSLITEKDLRDIVFRHVAMDYLLKVQDTEENNKKFINTFHKLSGNNRHINEINNLYKSVISLQPDKPLPPIMLQSAEGGIASLREIAKDRKVVFYFWSATQLGHFDNVVSRINQLTAKYKDHTFVGINFNTDESRWLGLIESKGLEKEYQYRADSFEELTGSLIVYPMNKAVIAKDSMIVNAFANLYQPF